MSGAEDAADVVGWVARIATGHAADVAALVEHFAPRVRAMVRGRLRQADAVHDLTQDTLLAVIAEHAGRSAEDAHDYLNTLQQQGRYARDVY